MKDSSFAVFIRNLRYTYTQLYYNIHLQTQRLIVGAANKLNNDAYKSELGETNVETLKMEVKHNRKKLTLYAVWTNLFKRTFLQ